MRVGGDGERKTKSAAVYLKNRTVKYRHTKAQAEETSLQKFGRFPRQATTADVPKRQKEMEELGIEPKTSSMLGDKPANETYYHCITPPFLKAKILFNLCIQK